MITPEDYVKMMQRRLDSIQTTAGEALQELQVHGWSKNLGKKDREAIAKVRRDLRHIISYASIMKIGGE